MYKRAGNIIGIIALAAIFLIFQVIRASFSLTYERALNALGRETCDS